MAEAPVYTFRYRTSGDRRDSAYGSVRAPDRRAALRLLADQGVYPVAIESAPDHGGDEATPARAELAEPVRSRARPRRRDVTAFTRELATLLEADLPVLGAVENLRAQVEATSPLDAVLADIAQSIRGGRSLSDATGDHPAVFGPIYTSMVRVGEESGQLHRILEELASLMEREDETRAEVLGAIAYPTFVLVMGIATAFVLLAFVLPALFEMLTDMVDVLPLPTRVLLSVSEVLERYWVWIIGAGIALVVGVRGALAVSDVRLVWDRMKLRIPILGPVFVASALGRLARTLGTLVQSGVSLLPALRVVRDTVGNTHLASALDDVAAETMGGQSLSAPLARRALLPPTAIEMLRVGEETGRLDAMLLRVAVAQERILRVRTRTLVSLLAPALILGVGALVGFIVIAILLPIFQMSRALA